VDANFEIAESCKLIPTIQRDVIRHGYTLSEQAFWLENHIDKIVEKDGFSGDVGLEANNRIDLSAKLSLLSEIYSVIDFEKMITIREKFQQLLPIHFKCYLNNLDAVSFDMFWPGCLECRHFTGNCDLDVTPSGSWTSSSRFGRYCDSKEDRLRVA
jgi:hypothetical protein